MRKDSLKWWVRLSKSSQLYCINQYNKELTWEIVNYSSILIETLYRRKVENDI